MKRILSILLVGLMILSSVPAFAQAEYVQLEFENFKSGGFKTVFISEASGNNYIVREKGNTSPVLVTYNSGAKKTGYMWIRYYTKTENPVVKLSVNGAEFPDAELVATTSNMWIWKRVTTVSLNKGVNEFLFTPQCESLYLDSVIISFDSKFFPKDNSSELVSGDVILKDEAPYTFSNFSTTFEAELPHSAKYSKSIINDKASDNEVIKVSNEEGLTSVTAETEPYISYKLKTEGLKAYNVWVRADAPDNTHNGLWIGNDNFNYVKVTLGVSKKKLKWTKVFSPILNEGEHIIKIIPSSEDISLDKIIITSDSSFVPDEDGTNISSANSGAKEYVLKYEMPEITPPANVHPRVYFTEEDIPVILENAQKEQNKAAWESFNEFIEMECDGIISDGYYNGNYIGIIESKAFDCALRGNKEHGREAVDALINFLSTVNISALDYNNKGQMVYMMGIVYDWCFDVLTEDEKELFQHYIVYLSEINEIAYPNFSHTFSSHSTEGMLLRDLLSASIAIFDERPDVYQNTGGVFFEDYVPGRKFFNEAQMYPQGTAYTVYRHQWNMLATYLMDAIGCPNVFGDNQQFVPYWLIYARRPDGHFLLDGDTNWSNQSPGVFTTNPARFMFLTGNYYNDPYVKEEALRDGVGRSFSNTVSNQTLSVVEYLIFNKPELKGKPHDNLPLSRYFPSPKGGVIARTSWDEGYDSNAVVAEMKINELYTQGHQHYDSGAFQIYYKGNLANDSGFYQSVSAGSTEENTGNSVYWSLHHINYYRKTIAHNCMLVVDPNEPKKTGKYEHDGGQGDMSTFGEMIESYAAYDKDKYRIGYVLGQEFGPDEYEPDYTYIKGDISPAYYGKTENYERNFMFLNLKDEKHPAAIVVMDRVVSKAEDFDKVWLMHGISEPERDGSRFTFYDNRNNYSGKLTIDTIYPSEDNLKVNVVGGEGQEFMVNGTNYYTRPADAGTSDGGGYRLELSPEKDSKEDIFLNVLQIGDTGVASEPLNPEKIETDDFVGVKLADRVVLMRTERERTKNDVSFKFEGEGEYQITVADLQEGTWSVSHNGSYLCDAVVTKEGGIACINGKSGEYKLSYKNNNADREIQKKDREEIKGETYLSINNMYYETDVAPVLKDGEIYVPLRITYEKLGSKVEWNEKDNGIHIVTELEEDIIIKNGTISYKDKTEPVKTFSLKGRTMIPLKVVGETLGAKTEWNSIGNIASIVPGFKLYKSDNPNHIPIIAGEWSAALSDERIGSFAFDGNLATRWAIEGKGHWLLMNLKEKAEIKEFAVTFVDCHYRGFTFELHASEDGVNFTKIFEGTSPLSDKTNTHKYTLDKPTTAKYIKFVANGGTYTDFMLLYEIEFYK